MEEKPFTSRPKPPFMTSTLQQEGGRKLRMSSAQVMRVAQDLYQGGYITYMRTDSTTLSETALTAARNQIQSLYGREYVPDAAPHLRPEGQERPGGPRGHPPGGRDVPHPRLAPGRAAGRQPRPLRADLEAHGRLADGRRPGPQPLGAPRRPTRPRPAPPRRRTEWSASGRTITFPGYLRAYVEGADDPDAQLDDRESLLPALAEGQTLTATEVEAQGHSTSPPARYTEASLVKQLEELGIGRPSTYASIMQAIQDRGYVWKKGTALVPTWTAFAVVKLLEEHFTDLVDYAFTARMEDELDQIAARSLERAPWLSRFWFGDEPAPQVATPGPARRWSTSAPRPSTPAAINVHPPRRRRRRRAHRGQARAATGPT